MKILHTLLMILLLQTVVFAQIVPDTIYAITPVTLTDTNLKRNTVIELSVIKTGKLTKNINLEHDEKIEIKILDYILPKRGKRNGYYNVLYEGEESAKGTMRVSTPTDIKKLAGNVGLTTAGILLCVPGLSQVVAAGKGLVKPNENQTRMQSVGYNVYKSTPLAYTEKGVDFLAPENSVVVIRLKPLNAD